MTRYHFNVFNRVGFVIDEEGQELAGVDAARRKAVTSIRSIIAAEASEGRIDLQGHVDVVDEGGSTLLRVEFGEAFDLHLPGRA